MLHKNPSAVEMLFSESTPVLDFQIRMNRNQWADYISTQRKGLATAICGVSGALPSDDHSPGGMDVFNSCEIGGIGGGVNR